MKFERKSSSGQPDASIFYANDPVEGTGHLKVGDRRASSRVGVVDGDLGVSAPVVSGGDDIRMSEIAARKSEVAGAERAIAVVKVAEVRGNARVVSNIAAREAPKVTAEAVQARMELFEDNGLRLNFADLLGDNANQIYRE